MKRNFFGEMRIQPGDDLVALWNDEFLSDDPVGTICATDIEYDAEFGWSCRLNDDEGNESECHEFDSEDDLREFLTQQGAEIDG